MKLFFIIILLLLFLVACNPTGNAGFRVNNLEIVRERSENKVVLNINLSQQTENLIIIAEQLTDCEIVENSISKTPFIHNESLLMWVFVNEQEITLRGQTFTEKIPETIEYSTACKKDSTIKGKWYMVNEEKSGKIIEKNKNSSYEKLIGIEEMNTSGFENLKIQVKDKLLTEIEDREKLQISNDDELVIEFNYNFSKGNLNLTNVKIDKKENSLITSLELQQGESKTLYLENKNYDTLCVKDAAIQSESEITNSCTGEAEYDFTSCLSLKTLNLNGINCTLNENIIKIENLKHSGIKGTIAVTPPAAGSSGSGGGGSGGSSDDTEEVIEVCEEDWICEGFGKCIEGLQTQRCFDGNNCGTTLKQPLLEKECAEEAKPEVERFEPIIDEEKPDLNTEEIEQYSKVNRTVSIIIIIFAIAIIIFFIKKGRK